MVPMTRMTPTTQMSLPAGTIPMIPMTQMSLVIAHICIFLFATDGMISPQSRLFCVLRQHFLMILPRKCHIFPVFHSFSPKASRVFRSFPQASNVSDSIMIARPCVKAVWQPLENSSFRDENPRPGSLRLPPFSFQPGGHHQFRAVATFQVGTWGLRWDHWVLGIKHEGFQ